ncbi:alpha/beta hydrolase [Nocardiopsis chromatogenes]|uniref:alpha/beta hydrolase n=1 Tax=Nocardiopsis chromatogenes TaxID=280239 RepID=UPI0003497DDC|nr:hypothetical protein [Nocardiopsis chromatogenes]
MSTHRFVVPVDPTDHERHGVLDVYRPAPETGPEAETEAAVRSAKPAVVFVHGGPLPANASPTPRDSPLFVGYCSLAAASGAVGVMFDHRFHSIEQRADAADDVAEAVGAARRLPGVDPDRVALWFFSGAGLLAAEWLDPPPPWLRCIAATYPVLAPGPDRELEARFRPIDALSATGGLPVLLTRVGRERPEFATGVEAFVAAAEEHDVALDIIDVPEGRHGFDMLDHSDASRSAVTEAMAWVIGKLAPGRTSAPEGR